MTMYSTRRDFLRQAGLSTLGANLALGLPDLARASGADSAGSLRPQRLVFVFSPNGVIPEHFWPDKLGEEFELKRILQPLADFKNQMLTLRGIYNQIRGDGDGHMIGIGGLPTGVELFPGDLQGGANTPAGWSQGIFLDGLAEDYRRLVPKIGIEDRRVLQEHLAMVRAVERELQTEQAAKAEKNEVGHAIPQLPPNVDDVNDNMPQVSRMQVELMVNSFVADFTRVDTYQITNSVGKARMTWLGIEEDHHKLSHEPDSNQQAYEKLIKINCWYCEQVARLAKRLYETPEPNGEGTLLDNTTIVWTNELGKGNNHTRGNIPFVLVGGGLGWQMGRSLDFTKVPHNRLLMSFCEALGHPVASFGNPDFCGNGPLTGLV